MAGWLQSIRLLAVLALACLHAGPAWAQFDLFGIFNPPAPQVPSASPPRSLAGSGVCQGAFEAGSAVRLSFMRVVSVEPRVHFVQSRDARRLRCPGDGPACRRADFLVSGDQVLAGGQSDGFTCITWIPPQADGASRPAITHAFFPTKALAPSRNPAPVQFDWAGRWIRGNDPPITIGLPGFGRLSVTGSNAAGRKLIEGALAGEGAPENNLLLLAEDVFSKRPPRKGVGTGCVARLRHFGRYLVVEDNSQCGGPGGTFDGVYVKLSR